jgi:tRNA pseudouridine38-40 synthase
MRTIKLTLAYDGTDFSGFQRQPNARSVQAVLEDALASIEGREVTVAGAGRTDSGVHALGQVASVSLGHPIDVKDLRQALNTTLPKDVRVLSVEEAPATFNARFSARGKLYRYRIVNADVMNPIERRFAWHVPRALSVDDLRLAARDLVGQHDFAAFQSSGGNITTSVRTISSSEWTEEALPEGGRLLIYETAGSGFLRHMVRTIIGTLVEVGSGRRPVASVRELLASKDRTAAGPTAPPYGLYLVRVDYDAAAPVSFS